jgi:hypothetical protein
MRKSLLMFLLLLVAGMAGAQTLTLTARNLEMYAGDAVPPLHFSAVDSSGTYLWSKAVASGLPALSTTATSSSVAGSYPITIAAGTMTATSGYSFAFTAGTLIVKTRPAGNYIGAHSNNAPLHNAATMMDVTTQTTSCGQAVGDGVTDDTAIINCLFQTGRTPPQSGTQPFYGRAPKMLYFPAGVYRLTGPINYFGCCMEIVGAGPAHTIFRLDPSVAAYAAGTTASAILTVPPANTNDAFANNYYGFTIEIGPGNPKAQGISYAASNYSGIENINIVADDSLCDTGVTMVAAYPGPGMLKNLGVYGCTQAFLFSHAEYSMTAEDITIENQAQFGVNSTQLEITFRNLLSYNSVPTWSSQGSSNVLMNAAIDGYGGATTAILSGASSHVGSTYLRGITQTGYTNTLVDIGIVPTVTLTGNIAEYYTGAANCNFGCGTTGALDLPINETPEAQDDPNPANWTIASPDPNQWAAQIAAGTSATFSIPVLHNYTAGTAVTTNDVDYTGTYNPASGSYAIVITIPDGLNHFACNGAQFNPSSSSLVLNVGGSSADAPFVVDHCAGAFVTVNHNSTRTVVVKHMSFTYNVNVAGDFYGEDVEPFGTAGPVVFASGQHVWIRQFDQETDGQEVFLSSTSGFISLAAGVLNITMQTSTAANQMTPGMYISFIQNLGPLAFLNGTSAQILSIAGTTMTATAYGVQGQTTTNYPITNCSYASPTLTCLCGFSPVLTVGETVPLLGFTDTSAGLNGLTATVVSTGGAAGTSTTASTYFFTATINGSPSNFTGTTAGMGYLASWAPALQTGGGIGFASIIPKVKCTGCTLWALNYKTEKQTNGGSFTNANVELLGGFQYPLRGSSPGNPVFFINNTNFFTTTQSFGGFQWPNWIQDTWNGVTVSFPNPQANTGNTSFLSNYSSRGTIGPPPWYPLQGVTRYGRFN